MKMFHHGSPICRLRAWNQVEKKLIRETTGKQCCWKKDIQEWHQKRCSKRRGLCEINTWNRASDFLHRWASFPGIAFWAVLANEDFVWQSYCRIWEEVVLTYRTNAHGLFLVKVEQITASFQNPTKITVLLRKTPEAFYFVNLKVAKAVKFHKTRVDLFLSATRERLQVFFSHNMSKWLTYCSFSVKRYGDRNNLCPGQECEKAAFAAVLQVSLNKSSKMASQFNIRYES